MPTTDHMRRLIEALSDAERLPPFEEDARDRLAGTLAHLVETTAGAAAAQLRFDVDPSALPAALREAGGR